jgi:hypothetical protein
MNTKHIQKLLLPLGVMVALLAGCGGGGGGASTAGAVAASTTKTAAQLSAEVSAAMAASTTISSSMDWSGTALKSVSAGDISVTSTSSMGDVALLVSTVDYVDPTTGAVETTGYRGTTFYDSRTDDPNMTASSIDASQQNASFSLQNVNLRSIELVYVEIFSSTMGLVYQEVVAASDIRGKTFAVTIK